MTRLQTLLTILRRYCLQTAGSLAVMFGIMAPVLIGVAGMSLDYSQAFLVKQRLAQALDAAALAAAASSTDGDVIRQKVIDFMDANYPPEEVGITYEPIVQIIGDEVIVTADAKYNTLFLRVLGINYIDVDASTTVVREVQGIEVALVMDNTGSMSRNNNIQTLRDAASNFVYIMYGIDIADGQSADPSALDSMARRDRDFIKVGLVPYSGSVNVGPYGLGEDPNGDYYGPAFVNNPYNLDYTTAINNNRWMGCVLAQDYPDDTTDNEGPWDMYRYCLDEEDNPYCHLNGEGNVRQRPNYDCPRTPVMPLSNSPSALKYSINTMRAQGYTHGNYGMVWGYRLISPEFPFQEGVDWDNQYWRKAVVMMTDGVNTIHPHYSAYGPTIDHNLRPSDLDNRFEEICEKMKDDGILIYTVTFDQGVNQRTKDLYRDCATSEDHYHDAPAQADLIDVFERISRELSNLHIRE